MLGRVVCAAALVAACASSSETSTATQAVEEPPVVHACTHGYGGAGNNAGHLQEWRSDVFVSPTASMPPAFDDRRCDGPVRYYTQKQCSNGTYSDGCGLIELWSVPDRSIAQATANVAHLSTTKPPVCSTYPHQWGNPQQRYGSVSDALVAYQAKGASLTQQFALNKTLMLIYETYGHVGEQQNGLTTTQLAHARALYANGPLREFMFSGYPASLPENHRWRACSIGPALHCPSPALGAVEHGRLQRCERLVRSHVDAALTAKELTECLDWSAGTLGGLATPSCEYNDIVEPAWLSVTDPDHSLDPAAVGEYDFAPSCDKDELPTNAVDGAPCFRKRGSHVRIAKTGCGYDIGERVGPGDVGWIRYGSTHEPQNPGCPPDNDIHADLNPGIFYHPTDEDLPPAHSDVHGPRVLDLLDKTFYALWDKQLLIEPELLTADDSVAVPKLAAQLRRLEKWNDANTRIAYARGGQTTFTAEEYAKLEGDQAGAMTRWWGALWKAYDATPRVLGALKALPCEDPDTGSDPGACQDQLDDQLAVLKSALGDSRGNSRKAVQQLLKALYTQSAGALPFASSSSPKNRIVFPLLADSFEMLDARLEELVTYHDFACLFKPCANAPTQLSRAYRLLAHLDTARPGATLADVLAEPMGGGRSAPASTLALGGWKAVFQKIATTPHPMIDQMWAAVHSEDGPEDYMDSDSVRFRKLVTEAQVRDELYRASGQLTTGTNILTAGVTTNKVGDLRQRIEERTAALRTRKQALEQQLRELTRDMIGYVKDTGAHESMAKAAEKMRLEYDDLTDKLGGLADSVRLADTGFASIVAEPEVLTGAIDDNVLIPVEDTVTFQVSSKNGSNTPPLWLNDGCTAFINQPMQASGRKSCLVPTRFELPKLIRVQDVELKSKVRVDKGQVLQVRTSGVYSPTCALRGSMITSGEGPKPFESVGSIAGPEGYELVLSNGRYSTDSITHSSSSGSKFGLGLLGQIMTLGTVDFQYSEGSSESGEYGWDRHWSAAFSKGILISNTPYNQFPAGALLMVSESVETGKVIDVQIARDGITTLIPSKSSNVSFVVNDVMCAEGQTPDDTMKVTVQYTKLESQGQFLDRILEAMSDILYGDDPDSVDSRDPVFQVGTYEAQGVLLPADAANIQTYAITKLEQALAPELDLDEIPSSLMRLFNAYINREIARIARGVEIRNIKRRRRELVAELQGMETVLAQGEKTSYLHEVHLARALSQIDERYLQHFATELLQTTRVRLYPALRIWYPDVLADLALDSTFLAEIDKLSLHASLDPTESVSVWIGGPLTGNAAIENALEMVLDAIEDAADGDVGPGEHPTYLTLAIPKPTGAMCPAGAPYCMPQPESYIPGSRTVDPLRGRAFWEAFYATDDRQKRVPLSIIPEDLYSVSDTAQGLLGCHEVSAVVRRVGFTFGHNSGYANADTPGGINQMIRYLAGVTPREQLFVTRAGWEKFTLAPNTPFEMFQGRVQYGYLSAPLISINAHSNSARPIGLSPFGNFELDVWGAYHGGWSYLGNEHDLAQDVTIVLEVDSRISPNLAPGIARCIGAVDPTRH